MIVFSDFIQKNMQKFMAAYYFGLMPLIASFILMKSAIVTSILRLKSRQYDLGDFLDERHAISSVKFWKGFYFERDASFRSDSFEFK